MTHRDAVDLIRDAVAPRATPGGLWADLGAGSGTFTRALAELLGPRGQVIAVDRDGRALARLLEGRRSAPEGDAGESAADSGPDRPWAGIVVAEGDLREPHAIPELRAAPLNGALFANALHFDPEPADTLAGYRGLLAPAASIVVVEYDGRPASPWIPHPVPMTRLRAAAAAAGFGPPHITSERPSAYGGLLYCARLRIIRQTRRSPGRPAG